MHVYPLLLALTFLLGSVMSLQAQTLVTDPPPERALRNPIDLRVVLSLENKADFDWRRSRVTLNGADISNTVRPLLEGAVAVPVATEQTVFMEQKIDRDRIELHIYGFIAPTGPHQVLVEVPRKGGAPLRYQAQYLVLP